MHGLVNRSIQNFIVDTYGMQDWQEICRDAGLGFDNFESMLTYDDSVTSAVLDAAHMRLGRNVTCLLEDTGTYLVTHPEFDALRRLLRFGGETWDDFLHSLDDMRDRARLALPAMDFPAFELTEQTPTACGVRMHWSCRGFGALILGILRAMADEYGALVVIEHVPGSDDAGANDLFWIEILDKALSDGRAFALQAGGQG